MSRVMSADSKSERQTPSLRSWRMRSSSSGVSLYFDSRRGMSRFVTFIATVVNGARRRAMTR